MHQVAYQLRGTFRSGAAQRHAVLVSHDRRATDGADLRQVIGHGVWRALGNVHADHLGNDLTGLLEQDGVTDAHIFFGDEILVVEGGVGDGGARQTHRLQHRLGGQDPGARPTWTTMSVTREYFFSGGYLKATAHLGALAVEPSRSRSARWSTFMTAPSMSKG